MNRHFWKLHVPNISKNLIRVFFSHSPIKLKYFAGQSSCIGKACHNNGSCDGSSSVPRCFCRSGFSSNNCTKGLSGQWFVWLEQPYWTRVKCFFFIIKTYYNLNNFLEYLTTNLKIVNLQWIFFLLKCTYDVYL